MTFYKKTIIVFTFAAAAIAAFPLSSNAATYIGGDVRADMTLTLDGSPYIVAGDLRIFASQSGQSAGLTIEAGVELRFEKNAGIVLGYSYYSNVYYGWIKVNGTSSQPVLFTANSSEPYAAYWKRRSVLRRERLCGERKLLFLRRRNSLRRRIRHIL